MEADNVNISLTLEAKLNLTMFNTFSMPYFRAFVLTFKVLTPTWPAIIIFGVLANTPNIVTFLKAGIKDNVIVLLFSLSVSDLAFLIFNTPSVCGFVILNYARNWQWPFDDSFVMYLFYWPAFTAYDLSAFISVTLGVVRCACVAMPLRFKSVFTKSRTVKMVLLLVVLLRVPVLSIFRIAWRTDPTTNVSSVYLAAVNRDSMARINDVLNRGFVIWINFTVMIICVSVLIFKLYEASKIRRSCAVNQTTEQTASHGLASKDLQLIKSVVLVCTIFIVSQLPFLLYSTGRLINPELSVTSQFRHLFTTFTIVSNTLSYLNASLNIFVYYNFNSKYRSAFLSMISLKQKN